MQSLDFLLTRIGEGGRVVLEGSPIYLDAPPTAVHTRSYELLARIAEYLQAHCVRAQQWVLLDEYNCRPVDGCRADHLAAARHLNPRVLLESDMQAGAMEIFQEIPDRYLQPNEQSRRLHKDPYPLLIGYDGRPRCALLDAALQLGKTVDGHLPDINIIVHPCKMLVGDSMVDFKTQQAGVLAVLRSRRPQSGPRHEHLPWSVGVVHIWLDESGTVCGATLTRNKGRAIKQITLPGWQQTQW